VSYRVLIVEDNPITARMWKKRLDTEGYEVAMAATGQEGRDLMSQWRPDAVLLDVLLPETDGLTMCRDWKADPETAAVSVICVSGFSSREDIKAALAAGCDGYVTKSADALPSLVAELDKALAS